MTICSNRKMYISKKKQKLFIKEKNRFYKSMILTIKLCKIRFVTLISFKFNKTYKTTTYSCFRGEQRLEKWKSKAF